MFAEKNSSIELFKAITTKNEHMTKVVVEACRSVPELDIPKDMPVDERIQKLTVGVREVRSELAKVQLELNIKITELVLRDQPSNLLEVKKLREAAARDAVANIDSTVKECTTLFK